MRLRSLTQIVVGTIATVSTAASFVQPSYARNRIFYCGRNQKGIPVTYVFRRNKRKSVPLIRWVSNKFRRPWTRTRRCNLISRRFQIAHDNGRLKYIVKGKINGYPVYCGTARKNAPCTRKSVLVTLPRGSNPEAYIQVLLKHRALASSAGVTYSGGPVNSDPNIINFEDFLNNATHKKP